MSQHDLPETAFSDDSEKAYEKEVSEVSEIKKSDDILHQETQTFYHLLGKTGSGRSSTGNTILGRKVFCTKSSFTAVTTRVEKANPVDRPDIVVVDGPGLVGADTGFSFEAMKAFKQEVEHNPDAKHVFLIICRYGDRFTDEEEEMVTRLKSEFGGQRVLENNTIVVLTCEDNFKLDTQDEELTFQEWCRQQTGAFSDLKKWCGDRVLAVDNTRKKGQEKPLSFLAELEHETWKIKIFRGCEEMKGKCLIQDHKEDKCGIETGLALHDIPTENASGDYMSWVRFSEEDCLEAKQLEDKTRRETQTFYHLLGKTGSGRSSTGNTILGRKVFCTKSSFTAVTTRVEKANPVDRPDIVVVDGPGLVGADTGFSFEAMEAFRQEVEHNPDAEHVFLIICRYGERFTDEEKEMVWRLKQVFGGLRALENHAIVMLTCGDNFERDAEDDGLTFEQWCRQQTGDFSDLRKWCKGRVLAVDNTRKQEQRETPFIKVLEEETLKIRIAPGNDIMKGKYLIYCGEKDNKMQITKMINIATDYVYTFFELLFDP